MANYLPKGRERMRVLARRGGLASGETRRLKRVGRIAAECAHSKWGISPPVIPDDGSQSRCTNTSFNSSRSRRVSACFHGVQSPAGAAERKIGDPNLI